MMATADLFEEQRPYLLGVAYRMLGSAMEAEDIVQEAYLRFHAQSAETIHTPRAYLTRIVTRLCLDHLKSARVRREAYVGPWIPEPVITSHITDPLPQDQLIEMESLSMAFLTLLESLSPAERAVFLLHEVFDYSYTEIAAILEKEEAACRQLLHRARQHIANNRPRFHISPSQHHTLLERFMAVVAGEDMDGLARLLAKDITSWSDGGGRVRAATRPIHGRDNVARFILGLFRRAQRDSHLTVTSEIAMINGQPGLILSFNGQRGGVLLLEAGADVITGIRFIVNPDKLRLPHL